MRLSKGREEGANLLVVWCGVQYQISCCKHQVFETCVLEENSRWYSVLWRFVCCNPAVIFAITHWWNNLMFFFLKHFLVNWFSRQMHHPYSVASDTPTLHPSFEKHVPRGPFRCFSQLYNLWWQQIQGKAKVSWFFQSSSTSSALFYFSLLWCTGLEDTGYDGSILSFGGP